MKYKVISKKRLRVRAKPAGKVVGYLKVGTTVDIDKVGKVWSHRSKGGYVATRLIKKIEDPKPVPTPKPKPVVTETNAQKIARIANEVAYPTNTSKANYPKGKPTDAYYKAFREAFPESERKTWKDKVHRAGANCGGNVGTVVRQSGVDKTFPHTAAAAMKRMAAHPEKWKRIDPKLENIQNGDIIDYKRRGGGYHICIAYGGETKEGSYNQFYPKTTNSLKTRISKSGKTIVRVYRAR